jgi:hypothetical protein
MIAAMAPAGGRNWQGKGDGMGWILLEALVALLAAVGIVWWTMRGRRKDPVSDDRTGPKGKP